MTALALIDSIASSDEARRGWDVVEVRTVARATPHDAARRACCWRSEAMRAPLPRPPPTSEGTDDARLDGPAEATEEERAPSILTSGRPARGVCATRHAALCGWMR